MIQSSFFKPTLSSNPPNSPPLTPDEVAANLKHLESYRNFYQEILNRTSQEAKKRERKWRDADAFEDVRKLPK